MAQASNLPPEQMRMMQQQFLAEAAKQGLTPNEFREKQRQQLATDAEKQGLTVEEYVAQLKQKAMLQHQMQQQHAKQGGPQSGQGAGSLGPPGQIQSRKVQLNPNEPPKPEALAVAKFLRAQDLKTRSCILDGQRKQMFKVKRAFRALQSPAYEKARKKNKDLPEVTNEAQARNAFQQLPLSMLALRVTKADPHAGHDHAKPAKDPKRIKGLWTVKVERDQQFDPMMHYVWLYEGPQWKQKAMAAGVLLLIMAVVMFPLWPIMLRQGVWYLSMGMMGLIGLFFVMAIFRLILFCITVMAVPPGLWLYPNLFEDVGFFDSFRPLWAWQETKKGKTRKAKKEEGAAPGTKENGTITGSTTGAEPAAKNPPGTAVSQRHQTPHVEEVEDE